MYYKTLILFFSLGNIIFAKSGCQAILDSRVKGCTEENILEEPISSTVLELPISEQKSKSDYINISKDLTSVTVQHLEQNITIVRSATPLAPQCPPFCIQPMSIEGVKTVAELETLHFIEKLKEKDGRLLIDARTNSAYKKETIPGAINLPYSMLDKKSTYRDEVLKLLGATKRVHKKWYFKNTQSLLIFGESGFSFEASDMIQKLIKLGYPKDKILYYRGGINSWKSAGLLVF